MNTSLESVPSLQIPRLPPIPSIRTTANPNLSLPTKIPDEILDFLKGNKKLARPSISAFNVSVVGQYKDNPLIPGVNLEFPGFTLNETIHGEQTAVIIAHYREYKGIDTIYLDSGLSACGHCRQFLNELGNQNLALWTNESSPQPLSYFLPNSFGPEDLGIEAGLLSSNRNNLKFDPKHQDSNPLNDPAAEKALEFASRSWAPYTKSYAGICLTLKDGSLVPGAYLECAAYNPSVSPVHYAFAVLIAELKKDFKDVSKVSLARIEGRPVDHIEPTCRLIDKLCPDVNEFKIFNIME